MMLNHSDQPISCIRINPTDFVIRKGIKQEEGEEIRYVGLGLGSLEALERIGAALKIKF